VLRRQAAAARGGLRRCHTRSLSPTIQLKPGCCCYSGCPKGQQYRAYAGRRPRRGGAGSQRRREGMPRIPFLPGSRLRGTPGVKPSAQTDVHISLFWGVEQKAKSDLVAHCRRATPAGGKSEARVGGHGLVLNSRSDELPRPLCWARHRGARTGALTRRWGGEGRSVPTGAGLGGVRRPGQVSAEGALAQARLMCGWRPPLGGAGCTRPRRALEAVGAAQHRDGARERAWGPGRRRVGGRQRKYTVMAGAAATHCGVAARRSAAQLGVARGRRDVPPDAPGCGRPHLLFPLPSSLNRVWGGRGARVRGKQHCQRRVQRGGSSRQYGGCTPPPARGCDGVMARLQDGTAGAIARRRPRYALL
jgi:hypothetical protein